MSSTAQDNSSNLDLMPYLQGTSFADCKATYDRQGFVVLEKVLDDALLERMRSALKPHLQHLGRNDFEGFRTHRVYSLLAKAPEVFAEIANHPLAVTFAETELGETCLLSSCIAISLNPGETPQGWHHDDGQINIPLPHPSYTVSAFWALDDYTPDNGATELIPNSHLWDEAQSARLLDTPKQTLPEGAIKVQMPAGSVLVTKGTLWHRSGANNSQSSRTVITAQYCPGWARQQENVLAATPRTVARKLPKRLRKLIGYSVHSVFMGHVDGRHPERMLEIPPE